MLSATELAVLRQEAATAIQRIRELPGFRERFEALPRLPDDARQWSWLAVLRVRQGEIQGTVRWQWLPAAKVDRHLARLARSTDGHSRRGAEGEEVRVPVADETSVELPELEAYYDAVVDFARRYVLDAEWSRRAVHAALHAGENVQLPPAPPRPPLSVPAKLELRHGPEDPMSAELVISLTRLLAEAEVHSAVLEFRDEREKFNHEVVSTLKRAAAQRPELNHLADRYRELQAIYARSERMPEKEIRPHARGAMWDGAVEHVRLRLAGVKPRNRTPSSYASRAKEFLNAAVNGSFHSPIPADPSDSPEYFTRWGSLLDDAAKALRAWRELSNRTVRR